MARIELRDATIRIKDGLSGAGLINEPTTAPVATDAEFDIDAVVLNSAVTDQVPVGARFLVDGETDATAVHVVTARTPTSGTTTNIVFAPVLGAGTYANDGAVTFQAQQVDVKLGDGNLTWTVNREMEYELDRGNLDTVREGDQVPLDVVLDAVYEFITTGTNETITPFDAMNGTGGASEWVSSSSDACEPYAVDLEVEHVPPCGGAQTETTILPDYRYDTLEVDLDAATVSSTGRCNAVKPTVTRT
jgi:hypothetical protein